MHNPKSKILECDMGYDLLLPFKILSNFGFSRYIAFAMHLDVYYVYIHSTLFIPNYKVFQESWRVKEFQV